MRETITAPTSDVLDTRARKIKQISETSRVSFEVRQQNDAFYLLFVNEKNDRFPIYSEGTYIIKRRLSDGKFIQIKVFIKNHEECYVRIYPMNERAVMEVFLFGKKIYSDINLPFSFADVLTEPFSEIKDATSGLVDWDFIFPEVNAYRFSAKMELASEIKSNLHLIQDAEDGAIDSDGNYVYIDDLKPQPEGKGGLNCSGFVKWVADGIYHAETGSYLSVKELKEKHLKQRGNRWSSKYEDRRDPYFGLDWIRNIAVEIESAHKGRQGSYKSTDVFDVPWAQYTEDVGFQIEELKLLMYYLAVNEPENIYLASINVPWGEGPILRQHIHTAVLIPIIENNNVYSDIVFERNIESNAEILAEKYPGAHILLTRIKSKPYFKLPELVKKAEMLDGDYFRR